MWNVPKTANKKWKHRVRRFFPQSSSFLTSKRNQLISSVYCTSQIGPFSKAPQKHMSNDKWPKPKPKANLWFQWKAQQSGKHLASSHRTSLWWAKLCTQPLRPMQTEQLRKSARLLLVGSDLFCCCCSIVTVESHVKPAPPFSRCGTTNHECFIFPMRRWSWTWKQWIFSICTLTTVVAAKFTDVGTLRR